MFMLTYGFLNLPWWGYIVAALIMTHITIIGVTVYLHRCQAHRALDLHPIVSHFLRFWLWLTTGMVTKEWTAVHRKHHTRSDLPGDPHSPQIYGIKMVLFKGVSLYRKEARNTETLQRYGHGTPDDWLERNLYTKNSRYGLYLMLAINLVLFGIVPAFLIWLTQLLWIPIWAAGVVNGVGHYFGYRNYNCADASTNIVPWGIIIGGEELHNNHHAYSTSAKLSSKWYEFDLGWFYIKTWSYMGLAKVKNTAPRPCLDIRKESVDLATLESVILHRYDVMTHYAKTLRQLYQREITKLGTKLADIDLLKNVAGQRLIQRWFHMEESRLPAHACDIIEKALHNSDTLRKLHTMRRELTAIWQRSNVSREQLLLQLQDWCRRAETSGIAPLANFSRRLRTYVA